MDEPLYQWLRQQLEALALPDPDLPPATALERALQLEPLRVEASHRRFYRLRLGSRNLVLMASPPELERNDAFVALSRVFREAGVPVPALYASDSEHGYFLMQDLGPRDLHACYGTREESPAVGAALALLPCLQAIRSPQVPPYTRERLADELAIFSDWLLGQLLEQPEPAFLADTFGRLVEAAADQPQVCVHRDYHSRNLLWNDGTLGVVDFQDALHGPLTYDLASLLHDCYYRWPAATLARYREQGRRLIAPALDAQSFQRQLEWMAIQRQLKAAGIFVRLRLRDGRASHLPHVLPTIAQIVELSHRYPELSALGDWLEALQPALAHRIEALASP